MVAVGHEVRLQEGGKDIRARRDFSDPQNIYLIAIAVFNDIDGYSMYTDITDVDEEALCHWPLT